MKALLYQCHAGISGDMHLGAMIDLGVPRELIHRELGRLKLDHAFRISFERAEKMGMSGTRATVTDLSATPAGERRTPAGERPNQHGHDHNHGHDQDHGHKHEHEHEHTHEHGYEPDRNHLPNQHLDDHVHRSYREIRGMITAAGFSGGIERRALAIFHEIAVAEAKIHAIAIDLVHFHEVGAIDSIVDIVAAAIALDFLSVDQIFCGPVELGSGFVDCAHGRYPVPAPATQEIMKGVPCRLAGVNGESTTPTGAAILKACVDQFVEPTVFIPQQIGYGVGFKDFSVPNVLRVVLGEVPSIEQDKAASRTAAHYKIEANIDDMSPEAYEPLQATLMLLGASDVYFTPVVMKKSRPATCLSVLVPAARLDVVADAVLNHSTTIGLRILPFEKRTLQREIARVQTSLGEVQIKIVRQPNGHRRWKSEYEDVRRLAEANNLDYLRAKEIIDRELDAQFR